MEVKMFQMGCGESIIMSDDKNALLIDYGSQSANKINYFCYVINELNKNKNKNLKALVSHFHEDHISGFIDLIKSSSIRFDNVYIPHIFTTNIHFNLIDYMLMDHYLQNRKKRGLPLLDLFKGLCKKHSSYMLLKRGVTFIAGGCENYVLWPEPEIKKPIIIGDGFDNDVIGIYDIPIPTIVMRSIFTISDRICGLFTEFNTQELNDNISLVYEIEKEIENLFATDIANKDFIQLFSGTYIKRSDYDKIRELQTVKNYFSSLKRTFKVNDDAVSIVFQTDKINNERFLFTGDITTAKLKKIINNKDLKSDFFAVKAPHHGTHRNHYLADLYSHTNPKIVFISNGKGGHAGKISSEYSKNTNYRLICTNTVNNKKKCDENPCKNAICPLKTKMANTYAFKIK